MLPVRAGDQAHKQQRKEVVGDKLCSPVQQI